MGSETRSLAKHQPCGCVVCWCEDERQCHGCGAKNCGSHPVGAIPNPVYVVDETLPAMPASVRELVDHCKADAHFPRHLIAAVEAHYAGGK